MRRDRDGLDVEQGIVLRGRLVHHHVEAGAGDALGDERLVQGDLVHDRPPARVHQHRGRLHHGQLPLGDHVLGLGGQRHVQRHHVGHLEQLVEQHEADSQRVLLVLGQPHDVVVDDLDVEAVQPARDLLADVAEPDDAHRLALELVEAHLGEVADPPPALHAVLVLPGQLLQRGQDQHDGVLGDRDRVGAAVVGDRHPGLAGGLQVERVVAGADELHELHLLGGGVEVVAERVAAEAHEVLGVAGGVQEAGAGRVDRHQLEAGRRHLDGDVEHGLGELGREEDLGRHVRHWAPIRRRRRTRRTRPARRRGCG